MTTDEARRLKPGDRVGLTSTGRATGTVYDVRKNMIWINWDAGAYVTYLAHTMPHITRYPQGQRKKAEQGIEQRTLQK